MGLSILNSGGLSIFSDLWSDLQTFNAGFLVVDDQLAKFGTDGDDVIVHRSAVLNANTALTGVLIGTPVAQALAANSLMISNATASGDIALYANLGGNSQQFFFYDTSASTLYLLMGKLAYSAGAFAFQDAVTISSTGEISIKSTGLLRIQQEIDQSVEMFGVTYGSNKTFTLRSTNAGNGEVKNSPTLVLKASYDADPTAGVTEIVEEFAPVLQVYVPPPEAL